MKVVLCVFVIFCLIAAINGDRIQFKHHFHQHEDIEQANIIATQTSSPLPRSNSPSSSHSGTRSSSNYPSVTSSPSPSRSGSSMWSNSVSSSNYPYYTNSPSSSRYPYSNTPSSSRYPYSNTASPSRYAYYTNTPSRSRNGNSYYDVTVLDSFTNSTNTLTIVSQPAIQQYVSTFTNSSTILGGQRDIILLEQNGEAYSVFTAGVTNGEFFANTPYHGEGSATLQYDGYDNTIQIDKYGLGGMDFTCGGECNAFRLAMSGADLQSVDVTVYTYNNQTYATSSCNYEIYNIYTTMQNYFTPYSSFNYGCSWNNVGAVEIVVTMQSSGYVAIEEITLCKY